MTSLDITSLFTNIPLDETINICLKGHLTKKNCVSNFDRDSFEKLLWLATKNGVAISPLWLTHFCAIVKNDG